MVGWEDNEVDWKMIRTKRNTEFMQLVELLEKVWNLVVLHGCKSKAL